MVAQIQNHMNNKRQLSLYTFLQILIWVIIVVVQ